MRYVLAAAEQMSFSGTAGMLGMRVSSVSRRVRKFKDNLGRPASQMLEASSSTTPVLQTAEAVPANSACSCIDRNRRDAMITAAGVYP